MKISQLKRNLQTIITSLNNLETLRENHTHSLSSQTDQIAKSKEQLEVAFANLESESIQNLVNTLRKQKTKINKRKLKIKKKKGQAKNRSLCQKDVSRNVPPASERKITELQKCQLRSSKKYTSFIDCLEELHRLKGGGDSCKLKESLHSIKSIWQSTENSIKKDSSHNSLKSLWDEALFGGKPELEIVPDLKTFLERRFTWDSYIDNLNGSHIPVGWVYPKDDARPEWKQFLQQT